MSKTNTDPQIWLELRQGNVQSFEKLYNHYWYSMYRYAYRVLNNKEEAQDVTQQFFSDLWEKSNQLPDVKNITSYLFRSLKNRILNSIRFQQVQEKQIIIFYEILNETDFSLIEEEEFQKTWQKVAPLINSLPEKMRMVVRLFYFEQMPVDKIAEKLGSAPQTIRNQLNIAVKRLQTHLSHHTIIVLIMSMLFK